MANIPVRLFRLVREEDVSGLSGTGVVGVGCQFPSGKCLLEWVSPLRSVTVYDSKEVMEAIHGHGDKTRVEWITPPIDAATITPDTASASKLSGLWTLQVDKL